MQSLSLFRNILNNENKFGSECLDSSERAKFENLDQALAEIERLRKDGEKLAGELSGRLFIVLTLFGISHLPSSRKKRSQRISL